MDAKMEEAERLDAELDARTKQALGGSDNTSEEDLMVTEQLATVEETSNATHIPPANEAPLHSGTALVDDTAPSQASDGFPSATIKGSSQEPKDTKAPRSPARVRRALAWLRRVVLRGPTKSKSNGVPTVLETTVSPASNSRPAPSQLGEHASSCIALL